MTIHIRTHDGQTVAAESHAGHSLARAVFLTGLWQGVPLCSGLGKCGLCRVRFLSDAPPPVAEELKKLGRNAVDDGWRLACLHPANACEIELPNPVRARVERHVTRKAGPFALAVDLGTTSIHWTALADGKRVATGSELNPQIGLGSEVMSRLAMAREPQGRTTLSALVTDRLTQIRRELERELGGPCESLAVSGNSTMTYILLNLDVDGLSHAPYRLNYAGGDSRKIANGLPPALIPPLLAPFVGADLSAGLVAVEYAEKATYPFVLADMGTNGEFILALSPEERLCASVPLGPALEGVGLSFGRTASPGAVTGFTLAPQGLVPRRLEGRTDRPGMTGTGYLSLCSILRQHGVLDTEGLFASGSTPLAARLAAKLTTRDGEPAFHVADGLYLPGSDVEEILKVKAAFNLALSALLDRAGLSVSDLAAIHLAGALGEHVSVADLEQLGFLPPGTRALARKAGNTSLAGTERLLTDSAARAWLESIPATVRALDLASDPKFGARYLQRMRFIYVD